MCLPCFLDFQGLAEPAVGTATAFRLSSDTGKMTSVTVFKDVSTANNNVLIKIVIHAIWLLLLLHCQQCHNVCIIVLAGVFFLCGDQRISSPDLQ